MKKNRKKGDLTKLKEKAWEALSRYKRQSGRCMKCGKKKEPKQLDAHHLVPKAKGTYALLCEDNIVVMCGFYCHRNWWHGVSTWDEQQALIEQWIGLDRYWEIKRKSYEYCKYSEDELKEMIRRWTDGLQKS